MENEIKFLKETLIDGETIIIYGTCLGGELALEGLKNIGINVDFFCDGLKNNDKYCDIPVILPSEIKNYINAHIFIAATKGFDAINEFLQDVGCTKIYSICGVLEYINEESYKRYPRALSKDHLISMYKFYSNEKAKNNKEGIKLLFLNLVITEKCTLNCKRCIELMPYYKEPKDYDIKDIKKPLIRFLECIDGLDELQIVGGEPFINKQLYKYLALVRDNNKIEKITIVSNGTIIPDKENMKVLKHEKVKVILDDYGTISRNINQLATKFADQGIDFEIQKPGIWQDCGELIKRDYTKEEVKLMFKDCSQRYCLVFLKGKFYRCPYSAHSINLKASPEIYDDYIDFNDESLTNDELRKRIVKLLNEKEFLEACYYCGSINPNLKAIVPAEQAKGKLKYKIIES